MKIFKIVAVLLVVLSLFLEFFVFSTDSKKEVGKPLISVSTFALYDIVKHIAGESVEIVSLIPFGVDPHSFELTPRTMAKVEKSIIVFYSGAGLEPWITKVHFKNKTVDMSLYVNLNKFESDEHETHTHDDKHCSHSVMDPHYWLDFKNMVKLANKITYELEKVIPPNRDMHEKNREMYRKNRDNYIQMLMKLDKEYTQELQSCKIKTVIINHNSLGYLAKNYEFHVESLSGLSPEAQPSPSDIKRILQEIKKDGVSTVFYENFVNTKVMESISKDSKVQAEVFSTLGNITADEADANASYETLMYTNLEKLKKVMLCN